MSWPLSLEEELDVLVGEDAASMVNVPLHRSRDLVRASTCLSQIICSLLPSSAILSVKEVEFVTHWEVEPFSSSSSEASEW